MSEPRESTSNEEPLEASEQYDERSSQIEDNEELTVQESSQQITKSATPLPKLALIMIAILIIAEAVGYSILYPIVPYMVRDFLLIEKNQTTIPSHNSTMQFYSPTLFPIINSFNLISVNVSNQVNLTLNQTSDNMNEISEDNIGLLVGILASAFTLSQLVSNWFIARASDYIGRKGLLMSGLITNIVFLSLFAISKNFWYALTIRIIHGFVNANIPIYKSYLIDVTDDSNQQKAFIIVSILWAVSNVVSPQIME